MAHGPVRSGIRLFPGTEQPLDALVCANRAERGSRRHARHRASTGQTVGAILAAISFRIAGHSETTRLGMMAALAAIAAVASGARLYHPEGARLVKPAIVADAP